MKTLKTVLTILLVLMIAVSGIAAEALSLARYTVLSPRFYSRSLVQSRAYDGIYAEIIGMMLNDANMQPGIPDDFREEIPPLLERSVPKEDFKVMLGDFLGGALGWLFYGGDEVNVPIQDLVESVRHEIEIHPVVIETEGLYNVLDKTLNNRLSIFLLPGDGGNTLRDYMQYFMGGKSSEHVKANLDYYMDVTMPFYGRLLNRCMVISWGAFILSLALLCWLWRKNIQKPMKIIGIFLCSIGGLNVLVGSALFLLKNKFIERVSIMQAYAVIKGFARGYLNHLAVPVIGVGFVVLALGIGLLLFSKRCNETADGEVMQEQQAAS